MDARGVMMERSLGREEVSDLKAGKAGRACACVTSCWRPKENSTGTSLVRREEKRESERPCSVDVERM